jgi:hypothetical protein
MWTESPSLPPIYYFWEMIVNGKDPWQGISTIVSIAGLTIAILAILESKRAILLQLNQHELMLQEVAARKQGKFDKLFEDKISKVKNLEKKIKDNAFDCISQIKSTLNTTPCYASRYGEIGFFISINELLEDMSIPITTLVQERMSQNRIFHPQSRKYLGNLFKDILDYTPNMYEYRNHWSPLSAKILCCEKYIHQREQLQKITTAHPERLEQMRKIFFNAWAELSSTCDDIEDVLNLFREFEKHNFPDMTNADSLHRFQNACDSLYFLDDICKNVIAIRINNMERNSRSNMDYDMLLVINVVMSILIDYSFFKNIH